MNPNLQLERAKATFNPENLTHVLDSGKDRTERRRQLEQVIERDPTGIFDNSQNIYLHRTDRHVRSLAKHVRMIELARMLGIGNDCGGEITHSRDFFLLVQALADDLPTALHWVMFVPNIRSLADDEQQARWLPLCRDWRMIGCYAQTELGHGSNVRALETTATFVPPCAGQEDGAWKIHSPTLTSAKFWPGTLGRTANHAMVIARLIDGLGVDRGIHNFLVPLRSTKDHSLLPGITTGDIGPKIGYNVMDNGYARFDQVLIPRRNMLMRFASVDKRGKYTKLSKKKKSGNDDDGAAEKIAYITMMQVRAYIVNEAGRILAMACCIAIRYSAVRHQGYASDNKTELPILEYTQQQHRLFPLLAASYCFFFSGKRLLQRLQEMEQRVMASSSSSSPASSSSSASSALSKAIVTDIHASSSALKAFCSTVAADGIEDCRKACGGHGFLACSGLPELLTSYLQNPTVEGDNHMLPQQVVKVLLKVLQVATQQPELAPEMFRECDSYRLLPSLEAIILAQTKKQQPQPRCLAQTAKELMENLDDVLLPAFGHRAARLLIQAGAQLQAAQGGGKTFQEAWNDALVLMARVSRAYAQLLLIGNFVDGIRNLEEAMKKGGGSDSGTSSSSGEISEAEISVLRDLARLFALYWMERELGDFAEDGYLSPQQADWIHDGVMELLRVVRPNAVALVDARDFSDFKLKSALGRYDGHPYPAIMEAARRDPLNQTDPGPGVEHIKRLVVDGVGKYTGTASRL